MNVIQHLVYSFHFLLHQITEHLVILVKVLSDKSCRSVCAVGCTEGIVYIAICIRGQLFGEFFLAFLHSFLCCGFFLIGSVVSQTTGFAFFFGIETEVFQQQHFARLQSGSFDSSLFAHAIVGELHFHTQQFVQVLQDVLQREFFSHAFRTAQVRTDDDAATISQNFLQRGESGTHTSIICNVEVLVQRHIEVYTDECLFTGKVELINCHNLIFLD